MENTTASLPKEAEIESLMRLGFEIVLFAGATPGNENLKMLPLMNTLLENKSLTTKLLAPLIKDPIPPMEELQRIIPLMPHENGRKDCVFFYVWFAVSAVFVGLRMYSVACIKKRVRPEDWFSLFALFLLACTTAAFAHSNYTSFHVWDMSLNDHKHWQIALYVDDIIYSWAHWAIKITFLIFYAALSSERWYRISIYVIAFFVTGFTWGTGIAAIFQCAPIDFWNHLLTAKCVDKLGLFTQFGALLIVSDFAILIIPITLIWKLQLRLKEKLILVGIFGVGGIVCVFSIIRLVWLKAWFTSYDFTWKIIQHGTIATVEINLLMMITCLPALKTIFFPRGDFSRPSRSPPPPNTSDDTKDSDPEAIPNQEQWLRKHGLSIFGGVTRTLRLKSRLGSTAMGDSVLRENAAVLGMGNSGSKIGSSGNRSLFTAGTTGKDSIFDVTEEKDADVEKIGGGSEVRRIVGVSSFEHDNGGN